MTASFTMIEALGRLIQGYNLTRDEARTVMELIMDGQATPAQIGSLMTILRMKGETIDEIAGFAETMRSRAPRVTAKSTRLLDTCGTGGDGGKTFNISTASAIVAAAGGVKVAKHGNRAMSSKSGSADVLESLGVNIALNAEQAAYCLDEVGICFMFSQVFHQSMKHAAAPRREIGFRTIFNVLGPLTNPAGAEHQLMGVFDKAKTEIIAFVMRELQVERALVVASHDGLDEISVSAPTQITELQDGTISTYQIEPTDLGLKYAPIEEIAGGSPQENAELIRSVLQGKQGGARDVVLANAGACFYLTGRCDTLKDGVHEAAETIDSGRAIEKLNELIEFTGALPHVS